MRLFSLRSSLLATTLLSALSAHAALLTATDFNKANPWVATTDTNSPTIVADVDWKPVGTIDVADTDKPSGALLMTVGATTTAKSWYASLSSGPIKVKNSEANLGKLTLGFMLSASSARPVEVHIESLDAAGKTTGELQGMIYPAAPNFYQRYSLDLSTLKAVGKGKFNPVDTAIQLTYKIIGNDDGSGWAAGDHQVRVDNVSYATPSFYVSPKGKDSNDGTSEKTAFATPQAAIDAAQAGDIILLGDGTYSGELKPTARFVRAGKPDAWIVLKNYPGQKPILTGNAWNIVQLEFGSKGNIDSTNSLAYIEIRGLNVRGDNQTLEKKFPDAIGKPDSRSNTNCISISGKFMTNAIHHIRIADNIAEYCPALGVGSIEGDWITIENNISRYNSWFTIYATSGYSVMGATNFDTSDNVYKNLIRNNIAHRNETKQQWGEVKRISDGNGIILDVNQKTANRPDGSYIGRTLVVGNLSYDNGGSGIHTVRADRIDIINNTTYMNSASPALQYSQIYSYGSKDVHIMNNILVAPIANLEAGEKPEPVNRISGKNENVVFSHNLYFGGNIPPDLGEGDQIADPKFVNPSRDPKVADFHLRADSPARGKGASFAALPILDLDGRPRPVTKPNDLGAYQSAK